jgi:hypothetical protein
MVEYGIITKQGDMGLESLRRELIDEREYDPMFGSELSYRLYQHDNSAFDMWQKNKDGKIEKKVKATCYICDETYKKKIPSINAANYKKRSQDLEKIEECVYILDNSWRRREQQQIEAIEFRGDEALRDYNNYEIVTASGFMTDIERRHLDTAYVYRDRMYKCIRVRDKLRHNIKEYLDKQVSKSLKSNSKKTRGVKKGGKKRKTKIKSRKSSK